MGTKWFLEFIFEAEGICKIPSADLELPQLCQSYKIKDNGLSPKKYAFHKWTLAFLT